MPDADREDEVRDAEAPPHGFVDPQHADAGPNLIRDAADPNRQRRQGRRETRAPSFARRRVQGPCDVVGDLAQRRIALDPATLLESARRIRKGQRLVDPHTFFTFVKYETPGLVPSYSSPP